MNFKACVNIAQCAGKCSSAADANLISSASFQDLSSLGSCLVNQQFGALLTRLLFSFVVNLKPVPYI